MLIDVHAHFYHDRTPRADWRERNASRLSAGAKIGITIHVASILGSWGRTSPTYFPSPADLPYGNDALLALQREHPDGIRGYVTVNPNYTAHARGEIVRCLVATIEAPLETELEENATIADGAGSRQRLLTRQRERFLAKNMNSATCRLLNQDGMTCRRRPDHEGLGSFLLEHQREVLISR